MIKTDWFYKEIYKEEIYTVFKYFFFFNILALFFIFNNSFIWIIIIFNIISLFSVIGIFISKSRRILYSIEVKEDFLVIEYVHLFSLHTIIVKGEDISIKYFYKIHGKQSILTLEFKNKNSFLIEIRDNHNCGWDFVKRKKLVELVRPIESDIPVKRMFGFTVWK